MAKVGVTYELTNLRTKSTVAEIFMMASDVLTSWMWGKVMRDLAEEKMDHSKERKITANIQRQRQMLEDQHAVKQAMLEHVLWLKMKRLTHLPAKEKRLQERRQLAEKLERAHQERVESVEQVVIGAPVSSKRKARSQGR